MTMDRQQRESERLEALCRGEFGDKYVDRNGDAGDRGQAFWTSVLSEFPAKRILEVGCNIGGNLQWISKLANPADVFGVDVNQKALGIIRNRLPGVNAIQTAGRDLPFRDGFFDLTFTVGVLIHQPQETLPLVMSEIVRASRRWVLCAEYFAEQLTEVPYRGQHGALFKLDFGGMYQRLFPSLQLRRKEFLPASAGWDDHTVWIFEKA